MVLRRYWCRNGCPGKDGGLPGNRNQFLFLRRLFCFQEFSTGSSTPNSLESQGGWSNGFLFYSKNSWEKWRSLSFFRICKHAQPRKGTGLWKRSCFPWSPGMILTDTKLKSYDLLKSMPWRFQAEGWCCSAVCSRVCLLQNLWQESWPMKSSTSVSSTALRT